VRHVGFRVGGWNDDQRKAGKNRGTQGEGEGKEEKNSLPLFCHGFLRHDFGHCGG